MVRRYNSGLRPFHPIVSNPHLLTIAANFWPRASEVARFPVTDCLHQSERDVRVLIRTQYPVGDVAGEVILVHGLEGSSEAGYMRSAAQALLEAGFVTHRFNLRSCGGTEDLCPTMYHAGLTVDLLSFLSELHGQGRTPAYLVGFSLGGNIVLKLAAELCNDKRRLLAAVCAVSPPIELAECVERLSSRENRLYERRFVKLMKERLRRKHRMLPERYRLDGLDNVKTLREIDERYTAPQFEFSNAAQYYETQSAIRGLHQIGVPTLVIQAEDDTLIPFATFSCRAFRENPQLHLLSTPHGGHLGFLSRRRPRFWADGVIVDWFVRNRRNKRAVAHVHT